MNGSRAWALLCGVVVLIAGLEFDLDQAFAGSRCIFQKSSEFRSTDQGTAELSFPRFLENIDVFNKADDKKPLGLSGLYYRDLCVGKDFVTKRVPHSGRLTLNGESAFGLPAEHWKWMSGRQWIGENLNSR